MTLPSLPTRATRHRQVPVLLGLVYATALACSTSDLQFGAAGPCVPGRALDCACFDGTEGSQHCRDDGSGFEPCVCLGDVAGSGPSSGPSSSATATATTVGVGSSSTTGAGGEGGEGGGGGGDGAGGDGGACTPATVIDCYTGPASTENEGPCKGGQATCAADGSGYGPCEGEVTPQADDCTTPEDENCDGKTPSCPWLVGLSATGTLHVSALAVDGAGNVFFVGTFDGTLQLAGASLISVGRDFFLAKLDSTGVLEWAKTFDGGAERGLAEMAVDPGGNLLLIGWLRGSSSFGGHDLQSNGNQNDVLVVKLDNDGEHLWSRTLGGPLGDVGSGIASDSAGSVLLGAFVRAGGSLGGAVLPEGMALAKLDASGNHVWSKGFGGGFGPGVDLYDDGDIALTGAFSGTLALGGEPLVQQGSSMFAARFDPSGNHRWSRSFHASNLDSPTLAIHDGDVVLTGGYRGAVDFGGGPLPTRDGDYGAFVARLDGAAGAHVFSHGLSGTGGFSRAGAVVAAGTAGAVVGGSFSGALSSGETAQTGGAFTATFDDTGTAVASDTLSASGIVGIHALASSPDGALVAAGGYQGHLELTDLVQLVSPPGQPSSFIAKLVP